MKSNISAGERRFNTHKTHTPEDVIDAGGATAFGLKSNKTNKTLVKALEDSPSAELFSKEEWDNTITELTTNK